MKRVGNLFNSAIAYDNLLRATKQAARGKKEQQRVAHFLFYMEQELLQLQEELAQEIWQPSHFRIFEIREPKPRRICAADFRDRVVHHALCNVLNPVFDKRLIFDTWACRKGKGSHRAVKRAQAFSRRYPYFLKCDVRRYFDSVDHQVLKQLLRRIIKDQRMLLVLDKIIDHPLPCMPLGKGIPIGNLTSQYFANLYLGELDHELKDRLGIKAYLRYMDDMLIFAKSKQELHHTLIKIDVFLNQTLKLDLKESATQIAPVTEGVPYLGFRIYPEIIRLNSQTLSRFKRRLRLQEQYYFSGKIDVESLSTSVESMIAHLRHANTHRLRQALLSQSFVIG